MLIVGSDRFNVELPAQFANPVISLGLVLAERIGDEETQFDHCWRAVSAPVEEAREEPLRRRSDECSDLFAVELWQFRRLRHDSECSQQRGSTLEQRVAATRR